MAVKGISRLFSRKKARIVQDFPSFVAAIGSAWDPVAAFAPAPARAAATATTPGTVTTIGVVEIVSGQGRETEVRALFSDSDCPIAIVIQYSIAIDGTLTTTAGPPSQPLPTDAGRLDALSALVTQTTNFLDPASPAPRILSLPLSSVPAELQDFRCFEFKTATGSWQLGFDPQLEVLFDDLLETKGVKELTLAVAKALTPNPVGAIAPTSKVPPESDSPPAKPSLSHFDLREPSAAHAYRLFFPSAFSVGGSRIRFIPLRFGVYEAPAEASSGSTDGKDVWFRFGLKAELGLKGGTESFVGFWVLSRPESVDADRFKTMAGSVIQAAGQSLAAEFQGYKIFDAKPVSAAAPVDAPKLPASSILELSGTLIVGTLRIPTRVLVPDKYPLRLLGLIGTTDTDPLGGTIRLNRLLGARFDRDPLLPLESTYETETGPRTFVPLYELLGLLAESDYRRIVQNFLMRHLKHEEIAGLFFYKKQLSVGQDQSVTKTAQPKDMVIRPQGFDLSRLIETLPDLIREDFINDVKKGNIAENADEFLRLNSLAYEAVLDDLRRGSLDLGTRTRKLFTDAYTRYVYPEKRKALDRLISDDIPFAGFRALGKPVFRSAIDTLEVKTTGASLVGSKDGLKEISRWCSRRKLGYIQDEKRKFETLLAQGAIDPEDLCELRLEAARKGEEIQKRLQQEAERGM